jgi:WD40 repeat protein
LTNAASPRNNHNSSATGAYQKPGYKAASDTLHADVLKKVQATFMAADASGNGTLEPSEFVAAFKGLLQTQDGSDEAALLKLFSRVDANCDGEIDWDEFSNYMLLESQGTAQIRDVEAGVKLSTPTDFGPLPDNSQHTDSITYISMITTANGQERYLTCGKDGFIRFWNVNNLQPMRTIQTGKSWVTCAKVLPTTKKLAVTSFSRSMKIYDLVTFEQCGQIQEIDYAPMR